jgi:hypothetical protein
MWWFVAFLCGIVMGSDPRGDAKRRIFFFVCRVISYLPGTGTANLLGFKLPQL